MINKTEIEISKIIEHKQNKLCKKVSKRNKYVHFVAEVSIYVLFGQRKKTL